MSVPYRRFPIATESEAVFSASEPTLLYSARVQNLSLEHPVVVEVSLRNEQHVSELLKLSVQPGEEDDLVELDELMFAAGDTLVAEASTGDAVLVLDIAANPPSQT